MAKRVAFTDQARADLRATDQQTALRILKTIARSAHAGEGDVKRLQGNDTLYRLRTQDHRVLFRDLRDAIEVARIRNNREAYR